MEVLPIRLSKELYKWLRKKAFDEERSMAEIIRELLEAKKNESK